MATDLYLDLALALRVLFHAYLDFDLHGMLFLGQRLIHTRGELTVEEGRARVFLEIVDSEICCTWLVRSTYTKKRRMGVPRSTTLMEPLNFGTPVRLTPPQLESL